MERQFVSLLDEFRKLPPGITRSPTFMEVAGYPHYENVCSNILAFFLDPKNQGSPRKVVMISSPRGGDER